jgi:hypothetical protein
MTRLRFALTGGMGRLVCALLVLPAVLGSCQPCLGTAFTFQYRANGSLTADDSSIQAPTTVEFFASERFEPECGKAVVVTNVKFYAGTQLLAEDTSAPFTYVWQVSPGKDGVPAQGRATLEVYAVANDRYTSAKPKLAITVP